jgi:hypothetical protein
LASDIVGDVLHIVSSRSKDTTRIPDLVVGVLPRSYSSSMPGGGWIVVVEVVEVEKERYIFSHLSGSSSSVAGYALSFPPSVAL